VLREQRGRWIRAVLLGISLWMIGPSHADAAARLQPPDGWGESAAAAPDAQRRASQWQRALGLRLTQVASAPAGDSFVPTIVAFETAEPVTEAVFADPAAAIQLLEATVVDLLGTADPIAAELRETTSGERVVWAHWILDDLSYECVLAPSGDTATLVVAAVLTRDHQRQQATLTRVFAELDGVTAAMPRFSLAGWRLGSIVMWIALALGLHAAMLPLGDREQDHAQAGKRSAAINLVLVIIGTLIAGVALRGRALALHYAGSSVTEMMVWVGVAGLTVVGFQVVLAARFDRGRVQSAPPSGTFSGVYGSETMRSSISRTTLRRTPEEFSPSASTSGSRLPTDGTEGAGDELSASTSRGRITIDDSID
jgi:hypothetical protein